MNASAQHVLVIGDGIVGSTVALELARAGRTVEVIGDGGETSPSHGNAGILALSYAMPMANPQALVTGARSLLGLSHDIQISRPFSRDTLTWFARFALASRPGKAPQAAAEIHRAARRSLELYDQLAEDEDLDLGFRRTGWLYAARTPQALKQQRRAAEALAPLGITHEVVDAERLPELEPELGDGHIGGVLYHDDISMDPTRLTTSVQQACRRRGVAFHAEHVVAADRGADGGIAAVRTRDGRRWTADRFVVATGAQGRETAALFDARLDVEPGYGWHAIFPAPRTLATRALMSIEDHVIVNAASDAVRVVGGMQFGGDDAAVPSPAQVDALRRAAERLLPEISALGEPTSIWRGARPMTPDGRPILERLGPGVVAVTGHGTLGMTLAPATAEQACALLDSAGESAGR